MALKKILVVEDNEDNRRILVYRLKKIGQFDIREATNGQEAIDADLLLHVIDANHPESAQQIDAVDAVLAEIGAADVPRIHILNKCDLAGLKPGIERDEYGKIRTIRLSALTGAGCEAIRQLFAEVFPSPVPASFIPDVPVPTDTSDAAPCP